MRCVKNELAQIRRFVVEGDIHGEMDPIYIDIDIEDGNNVTMTVSDHWNTTYSNTWNRFTHKYSFFEFLAGKHLSLDYIRRKLGIEPNVLNLSKSKREANKYFFKYSHSDLTKVERGQIASEISAIETNDPQYFNLRVYEIISSYVSDSWEATWAVCDYSSKQRRFLEAIRLVSQELGKEYDC